MSLKGNYRYAPVYVIRMTSGLFSVRHVEKTVFSVIDFLLLTK